MRTKSSHCTYDCQYTLENTAKLHSTWYSLFLRVFPKSSEMQVYSLTQLQSYDLSQLRNIYVVLYIDAHSRQRFSELKSILQYLTQHCLLLRECSVELTVAESSHYNDCLVELLPLLYTISTTIRFRLVLAHRKFIKFRSEIFDAMNIMDEKKKSNTNVSIALEIDLQSIKKFEKDLYYAKEQLLYKHLRHISVQWSLQSREIEKKGLSLLQSLGFYQYLPWHFYREDKKEASSYLEHCQYLLSYLALKINYGRAKTVSWMQGYTKQEKIINSAIGTTTRKIKWSILNPMDELSLRLESSFQSIVFIPYYLYDAIGKTNLQTIRRQRSLHIVTDDNLNFMSVYDVDVFSDIGEFWKHKGQGALN